MNQLVGIASVKGSPGATSTALALAAVWPRPVIMIEADPAGGDLTFRCRAAHGGALHPRRSIVSLAAAARSVAGGPELVAEHAQRLACGVDVVPGVTTAAQSMGLTALWGRVAQACRASGTDVIVDLGRMDGRSPLTPLLDAIDQLLVVAVPTLASVVHLTEALTDIAGRSPNNAAGNLAGLVVSSAQGSVVPVLVGPDATARRDCADLTDMLRGSLVPTAPPLPIPYDPEALARLEQGERATGRLGRTLLMRGARKAACQLGADHEQVPA